MAHSPYGPFPALPAYDLHNHTVHCGHAAADATVGSLLARADALGLEVLGFSEHVIFPEDAARVQQVRTDLAALDRSCPPRVQVLVGAELDPDPFRLDGSCVAPREGLDYVILSPHRIPGYGVGHWQFRELGLSEVEVRRVGEQWLDWYEACVEHGGFEILGHPLREPMTLGLFSLKQERTFARALDILERASRRSIAFELNNGWAIGVEELGELDAYVALVGELRARGMRFCRGSDSHSVADVGTADGIARVAEAAGLEPGHWLDPRELATQAPRSAAP